MPLRPIFTSEIVQEASGANRIISGVPTSITAFVGSAISGPVNEPTTISGFSEYERIFGGLSIDSTMSYCVRDFFLNGGGMALVVRLVSEVELTASAYIGNADDKTGIHALDQAGTFFNLLCIPPPTRLQDTDLTVYQAALQLCVKKRAMLLVDPPFAWAASADAKTATSNAMVGLNNLNLLGTDARNAALYFPRLLQADPINENQVDVFVPSGMVAGIFSKTDASRGVWKSPSGRGAVLNGIQGLQVNLSDLENRQLNPLGINCLRHFPVTGPVVWGARTLRGSDQMADDYKYIPVRRTALFIEESLYRGTQWVVFEPNDELLWAQIRESVQAFMHQLFLQGAFQGASSDEAYMVNCNGQTTTQQDIDQGVVNIVVGFAALRPAEFVMIQIQQLAGQING